MGSKHNPPKWWKDYDAECADAEVKLLYFGPDKTSITDPREINYPFGDLSDPAQYNNTAFSVTSYRTEPSEHETHVTWQAYELAGMPCLTLETYQPITPNMNVYAGMEIAAPTLLGYIRAQVSQDLKYAEDEHTLVMLVHDPVHGLLASGAINKRALSAMKLEF